jgi:hypothetical protein
LKHLRALRLVLVGEIEHDAVIGPLL